ncbi:MAG: hypothetical protein GEV28_29760 [Actinophytocola sp.]|nr:hypothetical protein [Actinophytocola sp.]
MPRSTSPAVSLTTLTFATILAVVKPWGRIRGGQAPKVKRRLVSLSFPVCLFTPDQPHSRRAS